MFLISQVYVILFGAYFDLLGFLKGKLLKKTILRPIHFLLLSELVLTFVLTDLSFVGVDVVQIIKDITDGSLFLIVFIVETEVFLVQKVALFDQFLARLLGSS